MNSHEVFIHIHQGCFAGTGAIVRIASVSEFCFSVLFADDTNMFITGKDMNVLCRQLNEDLRNIQEWLQCNKLSLNVLKTHYMIFTPKNKVIDDIEVKIHDVQIQRVYTTKFLGVQIDSKLTWKMHIEYTCKKLPNVLAFYVKPEKSYINLPSSAYIILLHTLISYTATMYGEQITPRALKGYIWYKRNLFEL